MDGTRGIRSPVSGFWGGLAIRAAIPLWGVQGRVPPAPTARTAPAPHQGTTPGNDSGEGAPQRDYHSCRCPANPYLHACFGSRVANRVILCVFFQKRQRATQRARNDPAHASLSTGQPSTHGIAHLATNRAIPRVGFQKRHRATHRTVWDGPACASLSTGQPYQFVSPGAGMGVSTTAAIPSKG